MDGKLKWNWLICFALLAAGAVPMCRGDEQPATQPASQSAGGWTLLNPTPADKLRGMDTDRPNVTNTPHTIDAGHLQIETGVIDYSYYRERSFGDNLRLDDFSVGQLNFRLGLLEDLEFNAAIDSVNFDRTRDFNSHTTARAHGFGDTVVGGKLNLWGDEASDATWASALAIQPQFKFPTAADSIGNSHFEFRVAAPFLINLPADFHLGFQTGVSQQRNIANTGYVTGVQNSISVDRVVIGSLDVYLEYASEVTTESHTKAAQTVDIGGTYPLGDNLIIDAGVNFGLNNASTNVEVLAGISFRF